MGRTYVVDDKEFLTWFNQTEIATGEFFDSRNVLTEAPGLLTQLRVFDSSVCHGDSQVFELPLRGNRRENPFIANDRIDKKRSTCREEHKAQRTKPLT
jgi:hypothetical protein